MQNKREYAYIYTYPCIYTQLFLIRSIEANTVMSALSHSRHVCCVLQQTRLAPHTANMSHYKKNYTHIYIDV